MALCVVGIPDDGGRRAICWKLLLNYLPVQKDKWGEFLEKKRSQYLNFISRIENILSNSFIIKFYLQKKW